MTTLVNRYEIIRVIGEGAFGKTYLAEDIHLPSRRRCVVKQLKPIVDPAQYQLVRDRFLREAAILESLSESNDKIPKLYAYFAEGNLFYLVQEWIEGETLTSILIREGRLTQDVVKEILSNILNVLDYIHSRNIIHRDIKPDNIIIRRRDEKPILIDFGVVKEVMRLDFFGNPTSSIVAGTPVFMALEQVAGKPVFASDLYSVGITAICLLTGKSPAELIEPLTGEINWRKHVNAITDNFAELLDKATRLNFAERYKTAREMLTSLQNHSGEEQTQSTANGGMAEASPFPLPATRVENVESPVVGAVDEVPHSSETIRSIVHEFIEQVVVKTGAGMGGAWVEAPNLHATWRKLSQKLRGQEVIALCEILEEVHEFNTYWTAINFLHFSSQQVDKPDLLNHILNVMCDHVPKGGHLQTAALQLLQTLDLPKEAIWEALLSAIQITKPDYAPPVVDVMMNFVTPTRVKRTGAAIIRVLKFISPDSYKSKKLIADIEALDYREATQPLSDILMRTSPEAASKIAALFAKWNYKEAASSVRKYVDSNHTVVGHLSFIETLRFLYKIEGPSSRQYIAQILHNCHPYVQQNLGGGYLGELANEPVIIEAIKEIHSRTNNPDVKKGLAGFIEKLG